MNPEPIHRKHVEVQAGGVIRLQVQDLMSVSLPPGSWRVDDMPATTPLLRSVTPEELSDAIKSGRFVAQPVAGTGQADASAKQQLHFAAIEVGKGDLVLVDTSRSPALRQVVHVAVSSRYLPTSRYGTLRQVNVSEDEPWPSIRLGRYDVLEVTLHGKEEDEFVVNAATTGLVFKERRVLDGDRLTFVFGVDEVRQDGLLTIRLRTSTKALRYGFLISYGLTIEAC